MGSMVAKCWGGGTPKKWEGVVVVPFRGYAKCWGGGLQRNGRRWSLYLLGVMPNVGGGTPKKWEGVVVVPFRV